MDDNKEKAISVSTEIKVDVNPTDKTHISETELMLGYRVYDFPGKGSVHIFRPTTLVTEAADQAYSAKRRQLLIEQADNKKLLTQKQMSKILEDTGDWTTEDDARMQELHDEMLALEVDRNQALDNLKAANDEDKPALEKKILALGDLITTTWQKIVEKIQEREIFFSDTVESYAGLARRLTMTILCAKYPNGKAVWSTTEELKGETLPDLNRFVTFCNKYWTEAVSKPSESFFDPSLEGETSKLDGE
jgi:hypothetical protein